jgi:hypothetical protein
MALPCASWAINTDIYRTKDLPGLMKDTKKQYLEIKTAQDKRNSEIAQLEEKIKSLRVQVGNNPKKNKEAARSLANAEKRKNVLLEKNKFYSPKLKQKLLLYNTLNKTYQSRKNELEKLPKKGMGSWTVRDGKNAEKIYQTLLGRAQIRIKYYEEKYSGSAPNIQEAARRQNFLNELRSELRPLQQKLNSIRSYIQNIEAQKAYDAQEEVKYEEEIEQRRREREEKPKIEHPTTHSNLPVMTPIPAATPTPTPVPLQEEFLEKFDHFLESYKILGLIAFFLSASLSMFLTLQFSDPDNEKHHILAAVAIGAITGIFFALPFPAPMFGFLAFILVLPLYYKLPMDKLTLALPISLALLLALTGFFLGITWFIAALIG